MKPIDIPDLRTMAERRLPRFAFDYLDGGAGRDAGVRRNEAAFDRILLTPRYLVNTERRDLSTVIFGRRWAAPLATAPIGLCNIVWPGTEEAVAHAAVAAGIPYTVATAGSTTLERIKEVAGENAWFMLYPGRAEEIVGDLIGRADAAGYEVMMVTIDVPMQSLRNREIRNGMVTPFRMTPNVIGDLMLHPRWAMATLAAGAPDFANIAKYTGPESVAVRAAFMSRQTTGRFTWERLKEVRDRWKRRLMLKGVLTPEDALRAKEIGCDGISVSNHGGRQLEALPAPIDVLPGIRAAVGAGFPVLLDGGIRSGEHIVKALALGADFVLSGRAIMYGAGALGEPGGGTAIGILLDQMTRCMAQIGYTDIAALKAAAPIITTGAAP